MRIIDDIKLDYDDVLISPKRSVTASRKDVELKRHFGFYHCDYNICTVPLIASNMDAIGTKAMAEALSDSDCITAYHKFYEERVSNGLDFITIGAKDEDLVRLKTQYPETNQRVNICIDVANGYTDTFTNIIQQVRHRYPNSLIMAGNVCTPERVYEIINAGADIVKVGIGPGSVCTTRLIAGVGYPQLSAVIECADAAHGLSNGTGRVGRICADGGCKTPGDVAKAFVAGADFVMLGGMLAGGDECSGRWIIDYTETPKGRKTHFEFYGMSSSYAQERYSGGVATHRAAEGKKVVVPAKGPAKNVIQEICGGLRSCCSYIGATKLKDMPRRGTFVRVNRTHDTVFG